jgi:hypothetical protein
VTVPNINNLFFAEMALFSGVVIVFALREIWLLTPKQIEKSEARAKLRAQAYEKSEALKAAARHAKG